MAHREDNINQKMKMALLTIILSAVFMPLTLLTGLGMNFESMPELEMKGDQKALLGMLILALCIVYSFQQAGFTAHR